MWTATSPEFSLLKSTSEEIHFLIMENQQFSIWEVRSKIERNKWFDEEEEIDDTQRSSRGGYAW